MSVLNDGGLAFPVTPTDKSGQIAPTQLGMSLRDYFAAAALPAIIQRDSEREKHELLKDGIPSATERDDDGNLICVVPPVNNIDCMDDPYCWESIAVAAYAAADAMIAEQSKTATKGTA